MGSSRITLLAFANSSVKWAETDLSAFSILLSVFLPFVLLLLWHFSREGAIGPHSFFKRAGGGGWRASDQDLPGPSAGPPGHRDDGDVSPSVPNPRAKSAGAGRRDSPRATRGPRIPRSADPSADLPRGRGQHLRGAGATNFSRRPAAVSQGVGPSRPASRGIPPARRTRNPRPFRVAPVGEDKNPSAVRRSRLARLGKYFKKNHATGRYLTQDLSFLALRIERVLYKRQQDSWAPLGLPHHQN